MGAALRNWHNQIHCPTLWIINRECPKHLALASVAKEFRAFFALPEFLFGRDPGVHFSISQSHSKMITKSKVIAVAVHNVTPAGLVPGVPKYRFSTTQNKELSTQLAWSSVIKFTSQTYFFLGFKAFGAICFTFFMARALCKTGPCPALIKLATVVPYGLNNFEPSVKLSAGA
jgi:hypothetical protein